MKLKKILFSAVLTMSAVLMSAHERQIIINTEENALVFTVGDNGRLYQSYFGKCLQDESEYANLPLGTEAFLTHGMEDYFEPALHINRTKGNSSTLLLYRSHDVIKGGNSSETRIFLSDPVYGEEIVLHYVAFPLENVFKSWIEVCNRSGKTIEIEKAASSQLCFDAHKYILTQYNGEWANEANRHIQELQFGKKVLDTKLGSRANMQVSPFFQLSIGEQASETSGTVMTGTLAWTGNFRFTFEVDQRGTLRVISGLNPYFSRYSLAKNETFVTPEFIFTLSHEGTGKASRDLHDWARKYQVKDGMGDRMTLLNNWEATYFDFNEEKLVSLISEAKELGVDMFLLDDGWFGNKYPRRDDHQGLGDWEETKAKLPNGIGRLTEEAARQGVKFGLWIEPEMVNPNSELYEKHKDWVITLPDRDEYYFRNQLVLDLSNPEVQDYVFGIVDGLMSRYPDIAYFKWDCNSPITNIYSNYAGQEQTRIYIDHVKGLYNVLDRVKAKYPDLPMMLCSGGGGRTDYKALEYFTEMWPSDNTDPIERLFIQWGYSQVFPAKVQCAHVTTWNKRASVKFRTNVAMMGKLGFDINLHDISAEELTFCKQAIKDYNRLKPAILDGDQYRLVSPYEGNHASTMFVDKSGDAAVLFTFDIHPRYNERLDNVRLHGLDADARYVVQEICRMDGRTEDIGTFSGDYLMKVGLPLLTRDDLSSKVFEIKVLR